MTQGSDDFWKRYRERFKELNGAFPSDEPSSKSPPSRKSSSLEQTVVERISLGEDPARVLESLENVQKKGGLSNDQRLRVFAVLQKTFSPGIIGKLLASYGSHLDQTMETGRSDQSLYVRVLREVYPTDHSSMMRVLDTFYGNTVYELDYFGMIIKDYPQAPTPELVRPIVELDGFKKARRSFLGKVKEARKEGPDFWELAANELLQVSNASVRDKVEQTITIGEDLEDDDLRYFFDGVRHNNMDVVLLGRGLFERNLKPQVIMMSLEHAAYPYTDVQKVLSDVYSQRVVADLMSTFGSVRTRKRFGRMCP